MLTRLSDGNPVPDRPTIHIERYATQAELLLRLSELSGQPDLPLETGASPFLRRFWEYLELASTATNKILVLPPDPVEFFAMPTVAEELKVALASAHIDPDAATADLLNQFRLPPSLAAQSIGSLSGGERALVALAKAHALSEEYDGLVMASPTTWVYPERRDMITAVADRYVQLQKSVWILLLDGQWPEIDGCAAHTPHLISTSAIPWRLILSDLDVTYPGRAYPTAIPTKVIRYRSDTPSLDLDSPTLVLGDNGVGKSTLALVLAGVLAPAKGSVDILSSGASGKARILMQNAYHQLFGMTPHEHINYAFRYDTRGLGTTHETMQELENSLQRSLTGFVHEVSKRDSSGHLASLLHGKAALAAERLTERPSLLILDEPSWGLSHRLAHTFVAEVITAAHARGVPVAVISHEWQWAKTLLRSALHLTHGSEDYVVLNRCEVPE